MLPLKPQIRGLIVRHLKNPAAGDRQDEQSVPLWLPGGRSVLRYVLVARKTRDAIFPAAGEKPSVLIAVQHDGYIPINR